MADSWRIHGARKEYRFSSLMKQKKRGGNCFVIPHHRRKKTLFHIYAVFVKQFFYKWSRLYYVLSGSYDTRQRASPIRGWSCGAAGDCAVIERPRHRKQDTAHI
jgi:hypothetical protein